MATLTKILLGSLLNRPTVVELASKAGEKAFSIIKEHFTYSAAQITTAYQDGFAYAIVAISVGVKTPDQTITQKIFNTKITREFADKIEQHYLQPFIQQHGIQSQALPEFRKQSAKTLKYFAKNKEKIFEIEQITEEDLAALISYRDTLAITDLVLAQMRNITPVDDSLAAFLSFEGLLGDAVLFFFRELIRKDDRLDKTQAALQREGLCIELRDLQTDIKSFGSCFENQLTQMLQFAQTAYASLDEIHDDVLENQALLKEILQRLTPIEERQNISPQIKARDEFTVHNKTSLKLIGETVSLLKQLPTQNPEYSRISIMVGSALSSTGGLEKAEQIFQQAIENANNDDEKALAYFNLFQVQLRSKAYPEALKHLQAAIICNRQRFALHNVKKYPIRQLLGAGGMGCVLLCENQDLLRKPEHELVVVKCFWESNKGEPKEVFGEALKMHQIAGDSVPKPLDYGYADESNEKRAFFVSEYLEGAIDGELWLEKYGPMDLETGSTVALQIAKGLQLAHEAGIYHLDLKPANILLKKTETAEVSVKIIDFGLSQVAPSLREEAVVQQSRTAGLSTFGQAIFGTLNYAPPEQQGHTQYGEPSAQSDIFAFGKTMYRLLTGEMPVEIEKEELEHAPDWFELLSNCVRANPKKRPSSAQELVKRLKAIGDGQKLNLNQREPAERQAEDEKAASSRYTDNGDGTVTDNQTGLIWLKNANCFGQQNWKTAMESAAKLASGQCDLSDGSKAGDWRLPTEDEWEAMVDKRYKLPALSNAAGTELWKEGELFSGVQTNNYWSSIISASNTTSAWYVCLINGTVNYIGKTNTYYVWPVRSGVNQ